jgi:hypothetical protein
MRTLRRIFGALVTAGLQMDKRPLAILLGSSVISLGVRTVAQDRTWEAVAPPRLSLLDGEVSFWRPGVQDWTPARVNTPLAAGDLLYTGPRANCEVQIGPRALRKR